MTGREGAPWWPDSGAEAGLSALRRERPPPARPHPRQQEEVGFRADVHRTQISLIESGRRLPRIGTALKLAAALEVELAVLFDGIVYRPKIFSAARGEFEISPRPLFELAGDKDRSVGGTDR